MDEKKTSIFRKESLDRVSSPEELDGYLKVTGPGVWFTLLAVIVLLIGVFAWMILGHLTTTLDVAVIASQGETICLMPTDKMAAAETGVITIAGQEYALHDMGYAVQLVTEDVDPNLRLAGGLEVGSTFTPLAVDAPLADGLYAGSIVVETVKPIRFITN